jgi:DNA-binding transcriptional ArsR family regulator
LEFLLLLEETPSRAQEVTQLHADICSALADPRRILLFYTIANKSLNVSDLAKEVGMSQPATSQHLKILRERGLIHAVRQGASMEYHLTDHRLIEALDLLRSVLRNRLVYRASLVEE